MSSAISRSHSLIGDELTYSLVLSRVHKHHNGRLTCLSALSENTLYEVVSSNTDLAKIRQDAHSTAPFRPHHIPGPSCLLLPYLPMPFPHPWH